MITGGVCTRGHAYFRQYESGCWYLACCQCPHRILEGQAETGPPAEVVELHIPEKQERAA